MKREKDRALPGSDSRPLGRGDCLKRMGLNILVCSPLDHDRWMASHQAIVQFLGKTFMWGNGEE